MFCRWEVWLQVAKRIGILAGRHFHDVFPCRWEVWLQVAKRIGILAGRHFHDVFGMVIPGGQTHRNTGRSSFSCLGVWDGNSCRWEVAAGAW